MTPSQQDKRQYARKVIEMAETPVPERTKLEQVDIDRAVAVIRRAKVRIGSGNNPHGETYRASMDRVLQHLYECERDL